jgi:mono/diheme cytochrome c family protein
MRARYLILLVAFAGLMVIITACSGSAPENSFFTEDDNFRNLTPPELYEGRVNPYNDEPEAIAEGELLYRANCASCHGITGEGDGPASDGFEPPPQNLAVRQSNLSDAYLFWRISEGGLMEPFNSLMPGWKGLLDEKKIWQVISYLRTLVAL